MDKNLAITQISVLVLAPLVPIIYGWIQQRSIDIKAQRVLTLLEARSKIAGVVEVSPPDSPYDLQAVVREIDESLAGRQKEEQPKDHFIYSVLVALEISAIAVLLKYLALRFKPPFLEGLLGSQLVQFAGVFAALASAAIFSFWIGRRINFLSSIKRRWAIWVGLFTLFTPVMLTILYVALIYLDKFSHWV